SEIRSFTIDTTAPATPVIDTVYDGTGPITGNLSSGQITDEARMKISLNRIHSPKGRATLVREWLRLLADRGVDPLKLEKELPEK
ncbi:hypothetical protein MJI20_30455, partial [Salmonella enterica subsp. enterica serovar Anatum]|nr:hypothetical protein [Salmonella enterica subsp. enterica serovar Anatum]